MPACCVGRLAFWPLLFTSIVVMLCITKLTHESSERIFHLGGLVAFFVWTAINMVLLMRSEDHERDHNTPEDEMIREYRTARTTTIEGFQGTQIARLAIIALPPVKSFIDIEDKTNGSQGVDCPICMEVFKNGELIQPFGLCVHEFHSSCINSWLHSGKTTCPLCRKDLATSTNAGGT